MLERSQLDPIFTDKFFSLPEKMDNLPVDFALPQSQESLPHFLLEKGVSYKNGVKNLVEDIRTWAELNQLPLGESLDHFLEHFNYEGEDENLNTLIFPLYRDGVLTLTKLLELLEKNPINIETKREIFKELINGFTECPTATHSSIKMAYHKLVSDLPEAMLGIRTTLIKQIALNELKKEMKKTAHHHIHAGEEIHYLNAILKPLTKELGIESINDVLIPLSDTIQKLLEKTRLNFVERIKKDLIPEKIVEQLMQRTEVLKLFNNLPQHHDEIHDILNKFGEDKLFNFNKLNFQSQDRDLSQLTIDGEYFVWMTLLNRLTNSGYFSISHVKRKKINKIEIYLFPKNSLKFSYIISEEDKKPFITYGIDQCLQGQVDSVINLLKSKKHKKEMAYEMLKQLAKGTHHIFSENNETYEMIQMRQSCIQKLTKILQNKKLNHLFHLAGINAFMDFVMTLPEASRLNLLNHSFEDPLSHIKNIKLLTKFIELFSRSDRLDIIQTLIDKNKLLFFIKDSQRFSDFLRHLHKDTLEDRNEYFNSLLSMIGQNHLLNLITNTNELAHLLTNLQTNDRLLLIKKMGIENLKSIITNGNQLAIILATLSEVDRNILLNLFANSLPEKDIKNYRDNPQLLELIYLIRFEENMTRQSASERLGYLVSLEENQLKMIIKDYYRINHILDMIPTTDRMTFLTHLGGNYLREIYPDKHTITLLITKLPSNQSLAFIKNTIGIDHIKYLFKNDSALSSFIIMTIPKNKRLDFLNEFDNHYLKNVMQDSVQLMLFLSALPHNDANQFLARFSASLSADEIKNKYTMIPLLLDVFGTQSKKKLTSRLKFSRSTEKKLRD